MIRRTKSLVWLCGLLIALLLCFIWGNSLLPGNESGALSGWFGRFLGNILPVFGPDNPNGSLLLRKCAHFTEFCLLGILLCWRFAMEKKEKLPILLWALGSGLLAAAVDESIQRFVSQRHGCIEDVLLDTSGVAAGILLLMLVFTIFKKKH